MVDILCLNVGSSSLSFVAFNETSAGLTQLADGGVDLSREASLQINVEDKSGMKFIVPDPSDFDDAVLGIIDKLKSAAVLGSGYVVSHRVVHGGNRTCAAEWLTPDLAQQLDLLTPLAPLHQRKALGPAQTIAKQHPHTPQVAVYDSSFHATLPDLARALPLPDAPALQGIRRFGFHGLSYAWVAQYMAEVAPSRRRIVALHLSGGCSACAIKDGRSIDTTMGATPLDGPMMGTRSGAVDPGLVLYLLQARNLTPDDVAHMLWHESGLKGVSGISNDLRDLLPSDDPRAERATGLFCRKAAKAVAEMTVSLGALDALVFTGGIGAEQPRIRERICADLAVFGIELVPEANEACAELLTAPDAFIEVRAVASQEEWIMAQETQNLMRSAR